MLGVGWVHKPLNHRSKKLASELEVSEFGTFQMYVFSMRRVGDGLIGIEPLMSFVKNKNQNQVKGS